MPNWTEDDYRSALRAQEQNPHPEFAAAIEEYQNTHGTGVREGQEFQISPEVPPRDEKLIAEAREQQRPALERPPEFIAPPEHKAPTLGESVWMDPLMSPIAAVGRFLPSYMGGGTEMWNEPSLEEFRHLGVGLFGDKVNKLGLDSEEYKDFANAMWADRYDRAQANNENVVRTSVAISNEPADFVRRKVSEGVEGLSRSGEAMANRNAFDMSLGMFPGMRFTQRPGSNDLPFMTPDERRGMEEEYPVGTALGALTGVLGGAPRALGEKLSEMAGKSILKQGAAGAATGVGIVGAEDAADAFRGSAPGNELGRLGGAALGGGLGGLVAGGGQAAYEGLRKAKPEMVVLEEALGKRATSGNPLKPLREPSEVTAARELSMAPGGRYTGVRAEDILAEKAAGQITPRMTAEDIALQDNITRTKERFYSTPEGKAPNPPRRLAQTLEDVILSRTRLPDGPSPLAQSGIATVPGGGSGPQSVVTSAGREPLPGVDLGQYKEMLKRTVNATPIVDGDSARAMIEREGGTLRTAAEAADLGFDLEIPPLSRGEMERLRVVLQPKSMNAQQYEEVAEAVDRMAKASSKAGTEDPALSRLQGAIREDRDRFGWNKKAMGPEPTAQVKNSKGQTITVKGWSAFHAQAHEDLSSLQGRMRDAGRPPGANVTEDDILRGVEKAAGNFRNPKHPREDAALMSFMENPGPLHQIAAARYGNPDLPLSRRGLLNRAVLTLDPAAEFSRDNAAAIGLAAGTGTTGPGLGAVPGDLSDMMTELQGKKKKPKPKEKRP